MKRVVDNSIEGSLDRHKLSRTFDRTFFCNLLLLPLLLDLHSQSSNFSRLILNGPHEILLASLQVIGARYGGRSLAVGTGINRSGFTLGYRLLDGGLGRSPHGF